jgi:hypothetical protein
MQLDAVASRQLPDATMFCSIQRRGRCSGVPGAAHQVLWITHLDPESAIFDAMLESWGSAALAGLLVRSGRGEES